jgi:hypothetical protein
LRIVDVSAVFDMARHAMYWPGDILDDNAVFIPPCFAALLRGTGMREPGKMRYFARALYSHCSRYITGMPRVRRPSVEHMQYIPVVPFDYFDALSTALQAPLGLECWLTNVIKGGSERPMTVRIKTRLPLCTGRRRRKFCSAAASQQVNDLAELAVRDALDAIGSLGPLPRMWCNVWSTGTRSLVIALNARQRSLSDE